MKIYLLQEDNFLLRAAYEVQVRGAVSSHGFTEVLPKLVRIALKVQLRGVPWGQQLPGSC